MPTLITIESGLTAGTEYWLEKYVTRIGSASTADICLPSSEIPPYALTLELREGEIRVYNRMKRPLLVGADEIRSGDSAIWHDSLSITLPEGTSMSLQLNATARAHPAVDEEIDVDPVELAMLTESASLQTSRRRIKLDASVIKQLATLVGCLLAMLFLLGSFSGHSSAPTTTQFDQIIEFGLDDATVPRPLLQKLQFAQAALSRGDTDMAQHVFGELHTELVRQKNQLVAENRIIELEILSYVQAQKRDS